MWTQQAVTLAPGHGPARVQCGRRKHPGTRAQCSAPGPGGVGQLRTRSGHADTQRMGPWAPPWVRGGGSQGSDRKRGQRPGAGGLGVRGRAGPGQHAEPAGHGRGCAQPGWGVSAWPSVPPTLPLLSGHPASLCLFPLELVACGLGRGGGGPTRWFPGETTWRSEPLASPPKLARPHAFCGQPTPCVNPLVSLVPRPSAAPRPGLLQTPKVPAHRGGCTVSLALSLLCNAHRALGDPLRGPWRTSAQGLARRERHEGCEM